MSQALEARFVRRFTATATVEADLVVPADRFSITVLFGPSGCGKTTTLRCLAGLERPDEGRIAFAGQPWYDADEKVFLSPQRRGIGYLFQDYALFPHLSAMGNIAYGIADLPAAQRRQRTAEMLDLLGLTGLENRYPRQLSGGEQQRVALARVLVRRPRLLLLDEPLSALDGPTRERLRLELPRLLANFGVPVVLVTHDRIEATALAERLVVLDRGRVLQQGLAADVFARPTSPRVARVVGTETILPGRVIERTADIATVAVGPAVLSAVCSDAMAERVYVCIRAEAVGLTVGVEEGMNRLSGRVTSVTLEGALVRVGLDCGFPLVARITWREWVRQGVGEGMPATAWVDPADVHLIALEGRGEWLRGEPKEEQPCERK